MYLLNNKKDSGMSFLGNLGIGAEVDYHNLNAQLNIFDKEGKLQLGKDKEAVSAYFTQHVIPHTKTWKSTAERLHWLVDNKYYEAGYLAQYSPEFLDKIYADAAALNHKFATFVGALKFYKGYALKTFDGKTYLENFAERAVATALFLARGDEKLASKLASDIILGRFQPATPTFLNAGKSSRGELVSCFLLRIEDNMESIARSIGSALQLSKRGGGVALLLTNLRETGAPIKKIEGQASGVVPVMKMLEDAFSYANQLGARQGAGAVYISAHHPDILQVLDTKRENADEKIRIKSLSVGIVVPDVTFELAKQNAEMALFSPYDVERELGKPFSDISVTAHYDELVANPNVKKYYINARDFFKTIAELQFESGYPYLMFEDTVNRENPIAGRINMSNLCSEILQVNTPSVLNDDGSYAVKGNDISCNLGSLNIAKVMETGAEFGNVVNTAVRALTSVSDHTHIESVPSVAEGNENSHSIGLGQMNLAGYLASEKIFYGSADSLDFTDIYFMTVAYNAIKASNELAIERGSTFKDFAKSAYADGSYFDKYLSRDLTPKTERVRELFEKAEIAVPTRADWAALQDSVMRHGIYNAYLQTVPPTGSISYINNSTASIHPITAKIEIRKEGKGIGRVYYPAYGLSDDTFEYLQDAYEIGYEKVIDVYAAAQQHVDQGMSLTLFFNDASTTRDLNKAQIYAWKKGIKTIYYIRLRQSVFEGSETEGCVSCTL